MQHQVIANFLPGSLDHRLVERRDEDHGRHSGRGDLLEQLGNGGHAVEMWHVPVDQQAVGQGVALLRQGHLGEQFASGGHRFGRPSKPLAMLLQNTPVNFVVLGDHDAKLGGVGQGHRGL